MSVSPHQQNAILCFSSKYLSFRCHEIFVSFILLFVVCRPVSKKLVRDLFQDRAQILRDRVAKFQAVLNTDHYGYLAKNQTDGPEIPRTH